MNLLMIKPKIGLMSCETTSLLEPIPPSVPPPSLRHQLEQCIELSNKRFCWKCSCIWMSESVFWVRGRYNNCHGSWRNSTSFHRCRLDLSDILIKFDFFFFVVFVGPVYFPLFFCHLPCAHRNGYVCNFLIRSLGIPSKMYQTTNNSHWNGRLNQNRKDW